MRKNKKTAHRIDDHNGIIKQYPKKMRHPHRHGFVWDDDATDKQFPLRWYTNLPAIVKLVYIDE